MAQRRKDARYATDGSLALEMPPRDVRHAAERYAQRIQHARAPQRAKEKRLRVKKRTLLLFMVAIAIVFGVLLRQIEVERNIVKLDTMRSELKAQEKLAQDMRLELSLAADIETVQRTATQTLGMSYPDVESMRQVDLPAIKTGSTAELAQVTIERQAEERLTLEEFLQNVQDRLQER